MDVPLHSKIKHLILAYYYVVLERVIPKFYSFHYIDLYSGDGLCEIRGMPEHIRPFLPKDFLTKWDSPFFNLLNYAKKNPSPPIKFFFNDAEKINILNLDKKLEPYKKSLTIVTKNEDANKCVRTALDFIGKPNKPSLFYLDPFNHNELKFSTIKEISQFSYTGKGRKPELIINLMIYSMLQAVQRGRPIDYESISESLGTDSWKINLDYYKENGLTHELFREVFIQQLKQLGYFCTWYSVRSIRHNAPQYYLIFCTFDEKKVYTIHKNVEQNIRKLQEEKWVKDSHVVEWMTTHIGKGQKQLDSFKLT